MSSDKRKILGKENIKKAQAVLKEKRKKEKNKPLEFESEANILNGGGWITCLGGESGIAGLGGSGKASL